MAYDIFSVYVVVDSQAQFSRLTKAVKAAGLRARNETYFREHFKYSYNSFCKSFDAWPMSADRKKVGEGELLELLKNYKP